MQRRPRVYIANTGGTIGMRPGLSGYEPSPGYLAEQLAELAALRAEHMPDFEVGEQAPLLDSAYMRPADWLRIARDIEANYDRFDGFVVVHGTDTMAYTASALPFLLQNLSKPVILTGSQIPLCEARSDARNNLITAIGLAAEHPIPEVCIYFDGRLLRGCRASKVDASSFEAFDSPNYPPLGRVGVTVEVYWDRILAPPPLGSRLTLQSVATPMVGTLRLFPGITAEWVRNSLRPPLQGLVLETYGVGNGPTDDAAFLAALREATARGVVIVAVSQCGHGRVRLGDYASGSGLVRAGVISGVDMTTEAALAKLYHLLSLEMGIDDVRRLMQRSLRGELSGELSADPPSASD
ncbi:MAG: asparaginase [Caldilineae bacterium]|nr:asparaginase [Caldilineae bacterium]